MPRRSRRAVWIAAASVAVAAALVLFVVATRQTAAPSPPAVTTAPPPPPATATPPPPTTPTPEPTPAVAAPVAAPVAEKRHERPAAAAPPPVAAAPAPVPAPPVEQKTADEILGQLTEPAKPAPEAPKAIGRQRLAESEIVSGMEKIEPKVQACYDRLKIAGRVTMKVRIQPAGTVGSVDVTGPFAGTETGACVAAAVKQATFAPFDGPPMGVNYAFQLEEE